MIDNQVSVCCAFAPVIYICSSFLSSACSRDSFESKPSAVLCIKEDTGPSIFSCGSVVCNVSGSGLSGESEFFFSSLLLLLLLIHRYFTISNAINLPYSRRKIVNYHVFILVQGKKEYISFVMHHQSRTC